MSLFQLGGKDLISIKDWTKEELDAVLRLTEQLKGFHYLGEGTPYLSNKTLLMLFFNTSTRTRQSFEAAMTQLGGHAQFIDSSTMRIALEERPGAGESIKDSARVMDRYAEGIGIRLLEDKVSRYGEGTEVLYGFAKHMKIPVINMASDVYHPCQALTDLFTMQEKLGDLKGVRYTIAWSYSPWVRSWGSVQSTMLIAARYGMEVVLAHPEGFELDPEVMELSKAYADESGGSLEVTNDLEEALDGATVVFPRGWMSPRRYETGKEAEVELASQHRDWRYTVERQKKLGKPGYLLHCMPIDRGNEVDSQICDDPELSFIYDQAENRLHAQKAILALTMGRRV